MGLSNKTERADLKYSKFKELNYEMVKWKMTKTGYAFNYLLPITHRLVGTAIQVSHFLIGK